MERTLEFLALATLTGMLASAVSASPLPTPAECRLQAAKPIPAEVFNHGFLEAHPDLRWRSVGLGHYRDGDYPAAVESFKRAARHADKFSQSMVARMYWNGEGVDVDRPLGYVWMDLAAERMYHDFLRERELYWVGMTADEQADALLRGPAVFAEYADEHAKPRMERALAHGRRQLTGSRLGVVQPGLVVMPRTGPLANTEVPAHLVYDDAWWDAEHYWCAQDAYWSRPLNPDVDVGLPQAVPAEVLE